MTPRGFAAGLAEALLLGCCVCVHAAPARLQDETQLVAALARSPQCCVIDARSAQHRKEGELAGALPYSDTLRIKPTSTVIVVADDDARALVVAKALARSSPHPVYAVKGGYMAWQSVALRVQIEADKPGSKFGFVIPHDTCQQGTPLHVFEAQPAGSAASQPKTGRP